MPGVRVIVRQMTGAATHGHLRYGIHAMFATHRCASVRVDSRAPMVDRALIADHVCEVEQAEHQVVRKSRLVPNEPGYTPLVSCVDFYLNKCSLRRLPRRLRQ